MKYLVADDHGHVHMAVTAILRTQFQVPRQDIVLLGDGDTLLNLVRTGDYPSALLTLDLSMPGRFKRLLLVNNLLAISSTLRIVVYSAHLSAHLAADLLRSGVSACVSKGLSNRPLCRGIEAALSGEIYVDPAVDLSSVQKAPWNKLTPRQRSFVIDVCRDLSNEQIAERNGVTTNTVSAHKREAMYRLGVSKDSLLPRYLEEHGLSYLLDE